MSAAIDFMDRFRARAAALGRTDIEAEWSLAVRDHQFPLTAEGHRLLADPWSRLAELVGTPALDAVIRWLLTPAEQQGSGLLMYGSTGSGKSFAAAFLCVVRHVLRPDGGEGPEWVHAADLAHRVRMEHDVNVHARTFVLDDLGGAAITDAQITALEYVLDARGKPGRVIALTSNAQPSTLMKAFRERNESRIKALFRDGVIMCNGEDLR